jgi:catalase (peroxidase I)
MAAQGAQAWAPMTRTGAGRKVASRADLLHRHSPLSNPMPGDFDYAEEFTRLDPAAVKRDLLPLMTDSRTS